MKNKNFLLTIGFVCITSYSFAQDAALTQKNITADNTLLKVFQTGDVALLDSIISPDFVNHTAMGDRQGIEILKTQVKDFHTNFKPIKVKLIKRLFDEEYVSDWLRFVGEAPNALIEGIEMTKYVNGKAVAHWFFPNSQKK